MAARSVSEITCSGCKRVDERENGTGRACFHLRRNPWRVTRWSWAKHLRPGPHWPLAYTISATSTSEQGIPSRTTSSTGRAVRLRDDQREERTRHVRRLLGRCMANLASRHRGSSGLESRRSGMSACKVRHERVAGKLHCRWVELGNRLPRLVPSIGRIHPRATPAGRAETGLRGQSSP